MSIALLRVVSLVLCALAVVGCANHKPFSRNDLNTPASELDHELVGFPVDVKPVTDPEQIDYQLALKDRGLYLSSLNIIKMLNPTECSVEVVGHRGFYTQPENSISAIRYGLVSDNNCIELDLMKLRDSNWVLQHDIVIGRSNGRSDGKRMLVETMDTRSWGRVVMRVPQTGELNANEHAPYILSALDEIVRFLAPGQQINFELKSTAKTDELAVLDGAIKKVLGERYYYSSLNLETLAAMRAVNPHVYLGFIQKPHTKSIQALKEQLGNAAETDASYVKYQSEIEWAGRLGQRYYNKRTSDWTTAGSLDLIKSKIGANSGLHLDIRRFSETPNVLIRAHQRGMKVHTYSINSPQYHQNQLAKMAAKDRMPDAVIVDSEPYKICQQAYGLFHPRGQYQARYPLGKLLSKLPADADIEQMVDQANYVPNGLYLRLDGEVIELDMDSRSKAGRTKSPTLLVLPLRDEDELLDLKTRGAIKINLRRVM